MKRSTQETIQKIKESYINYRSVFIPGTQLFNILVELGANPAHVDEMKVISEQLFNDPTLVFRRSRNGRFCYNLEKQCCYRTEFQPFVLSFDEDFVRHDSGDIRHFRGLNDRLQHNSIFQSLLLFKHLVCHDVATAPRKYLNYDSPNWVSTVFHLRTVTSPSLVGEPALEGVHTDGVDHTMTTLLGHKNMADHSAKTFIHHMKEKNALKWHEADPTFILDEKQHLNFLDTLLICDNERKHSLTAVEASNPAKDATRDMLIFFTRKPALEGHVSFPYDSLKAHPDYPISFNLNV
ncbi:TPA: 2OG-Fe dioxygenase family protein [Vibrio diabolicus]|nr:2OG-Fe dioxygenase family protein [Vibrio alginolyticus]